VPSGRISPSLCQEEGAVIASPIGTPNNQGNGIQQLRAEIIKFIKAELHDALSAGVGVAPGFNGASFAGFAVTTTSTPVCSANIVVPTGFTQAMCLVTVDATCNNPTASADWLYVHAVAVSGGGGEAFAGVSAGGYGNASASAGQLVSGLVAGSSLVISTNVRSGNANWAASGSNAANVNGIVVFLR
jgi:hypothetical protein